LCGFLKLLKDPGGEALCEGVCDGGKGASSIGKSMQIERGPSPIVRASKILHQRFLKIVILGKPPHVVSAAFL